MNRIEKIIFVLLFFCSCLYSFIIPDESINDIETKVSIEIYVQGAVNDSLTYDHSPTIKDVLDSLHLKNVYGFEEDYILNSQSYFYIPENSQGISLNNATAKELMTIKGIGEVTANKIIEYRNNERFHTIEDLMKVQGIGEKKYRKYRSYLCL